MNWDFLKPKEDPHGPNLYREMELGMHAQSLLASEAYQRATQKIREAIHIEWSRSPITDRDGQHELRLMLKLLDGLEAHIKSEADSGKLAAAQIEQEGKRK